MEFSPIHFYGEPIQVGFESEPLLQKKPGCPATFIWRDETFRISAVISEWHDYRRRGKMSRNMSPPHAAVAQKRGSWGVGQDYFRVQTENNRYFDIYFDRKPSCTDQRLGAWYIYRELEPHEPPAS